MFDTKTRFSAAVFFTTVMIGLSVCSYGYAGQSHTGILLSDDQGNILFAQNRNKPFIPASILKILTSLCALHTFGETHRFSTAYTVDKNSKDLFIKGFGDPLLISEVIEKLCRDIRINTDQIHDIILDQTYFSTPVQIPGRRNTLNPYDAPNGALCANFNTILFKWNDRENRFVSGEPQTPLLDIFHDDIKKTGLKQGRIVLSSQQSLLYPGFLIRYFLKKNNISVTGNIMQGEFIGTTGKNHLFESTFTLVNILQKLLKFSNNYIANQLLLTIGAKEFGAPATLEKGVRAIQLFSKNQLGLNLHSISEGSGLSKHNLVSPDQMIKILIDFMPYYTVLNRRDNDYYKTGTLSGVRTRAGYIMGQDKRLYPYVIMVNEKNSGYEAIRRSLVNRVFRASLPAE